MSDKRDYARRMGYHERYFHSDAETHVCYCVCHQHPGAYPTTLQRPCCSCGHVHAYGFMRGSIRDGWLPTIRYRRAVGED